MKLFTAEKLNSRTRSSSFEGWLLLAFILVTYVPFFSYRVVRLGSDDRVYVAQALEMAESGSWFVQTLNGLPDYYKGPLHYILIRIGMVFFHYSMWATVYMNLILLAISALCLGKIVQRNMREFTGWNFFAGMAFAANLGIFIHMFASQMEIEAAAFMAIGLYFLDRASSPRQDLKFWLVAGILGWVKSPLHSVLLGTSALLFWGWHKELLPRLKNPEAWGAVLAGVLVCAAGYAPAFFLDRENFVNAYVLRETFWKGSNGEPWYFPLISTFSYYLIPWTLPAFVAFADGITRLFPRWQRPTFSSPGSRRVAALGIALVIPSATFFLLHPYRLKNYNLPIIGGLILVLVAVWATRSKGWDKFYKISLGITALLALLAIGGLLFAKQHFHPLPDWWSSTTLPYLFMGLLFWAFGIWREGITFQMLRPDSLSRRSIWLFLGLGALFTLLGEREMIDIRNRIDQAKKAGEKIRVSYFDRQQNIWSERAYLNFMIPYPVEGIFNPGALKEAAARGDLILAPNKNRLKDMHTHLDALYPPQQWKVEVWRRWGPDGFNGLNMSGWKQAWDNQDLSSLDDNFYMVTLINPSGS